MKKSAAITRAARPTAARKVKNRLLCADFILPSFGNRRAPPKTTFRSWVDGGSSVFGGDDFIAAPFVDVFLTFNPLSSGNLRQEIGYLATENSRPSPGSSLILTIRSLSRVLNFRSE